MSQRPQGKDFGQFGILPADRFFRLLSHILYAVYDSQFITLNSQFSIH